MSAHVGMLSKILSISEPVSFIVCRFTSVLPLPLTYLQAKVAPALRCEAVGEIHTFFLQVAVR